MQAEGWLGTYALGSSYIALPWLCGHAMFSASTITPQEVILTVLYSIAGLGIAIVNDFKSIEGDAALGMNSLPVAFGIDTAKWICVASIDVTQLGVAAYLYSIGESTYAAILFGLVLPQMFAQYTFVQARAIDRPRLDLAPPLPSCRSPRVPRSVPSSAPAHKPLPRAAMRPMALLKKEYLWR